jgi:hypothetical protein
MIFAWGQIINFGMMMIDQTLEASGVELRLGLHLRLVIPAVQEWPCKVSSPLDLVSVPYNLPEASKFGGQLVHHEGSRASG